MYQFWQINLTTYTNPTWTKLNKSNDLRTDKARQWSDLGVIKIWLIISPSVFPKFGADLVYLISDCALFRKYGWLWSRRKPHLGLNVTMITYLPVRTLPLGFGDTPVVPPDVIYQDISPFVFWKSFSNFFALHHCLCPPMRPCLFWAQMIMSDLTALLARNFVAHLLGHLLAHLPSYWVALLPRYLVSKSCLPSPPQLQVVRCIFQIFSKSR